MVSPQLFLTHPRIAVAAAHAEIFDLAGKLFGFGGAEVFTRTSFTPIPSSGDLAFTKSSGPGQTVKTPGGDDNKPGTSGAKAF